MSKPEIVGDQQTTLAELKKRVSEFVDARDWAKYHNPKDVAISIAIEAAELLEHFQWVGETEASEEVRDELADVVIYCLSFANAMGIDLSRAVIEKIGKNEAKYPCDLVRGDYRKYTEIGRLDEDH